MPVPAIVPAELAFSADGTPYSPLYGDVYHPAAGAPAQAAHVFLGGNGLPERWRDRERFVILETGFGIGLNFLATWMAWREAGRPCRLHFVSVELHPFRADDLARLLRAHPALAEPANALLAAWPPLTPGLHRLHFDDDRVTLTLGLGDAAQLLPRIVARADAVFLDGFAPDRNPVLWSAEVLAHVTRLCADDATLATWSVAGALRRALDAQGWQVSRRPGCGNKREMLTARRATLGAVPPRLTFAPDLHALVIGAGLAGAAISERLAARGWRIDLIEQHPAPARDASGNPAGVIFPRLARDDAIGARLSRAAYLHALASLRELPDVPWRACGVLQIARDAAHEAAQRAAIDALSLPAVFAGFMPRDAVAARLGTQAAFGGWWFPGGGWVSPADFCAALIARHADRVRGHFGRSVSRITQQGDDWHAHDARGQVIAHAPHVVIANAHAANALLPSPLPLAPVRGQISLLPAHPRPDLDIVLCRNGYLTPASSGTVCLGASFDGRDLDLRLRQEDHAGNLARLDELLPGSAAAYDAATLAGRAGLRTTTPDRLPLAGTLPDTTVPVTPMSSRAPSLSTLPRHSGLHVLLGLGSRGIVWAPLSAELLAARLHGDPLPVERELADALDPARFHLRALRKGKPPTAPSPGFSGETDL